MKIRMEENYEPTAAEIAEAVADIETDPTLEDIWGIIEDELEGDGEWD